MNSITCPQKLFEVLELSERYQVWDFKTLVNEALQNFVVTRENFQFSATVHTSPRANSTQSVCN